MDAPLDILLERSTWTRELARRLVRYSDDADDLVQQTWVAALERPPSRSIPIKSWIAGVMRNLARERRRGDARRTQREQVAARGEIDCSREGLVEKLETHRALVAAVAALGEPSRSTVLMRYFEGLSPREIARRTNTPVRTVHTRLHRALHELRRKLDTRYDRSTWMLALAPLARAKHATLAAWGAVILDAKLKVACAAVAVVGAASFFALRPATSASPSPAVAESANTAVATLDGNAEAPQRVRTEVGGSEKSPQSSTEAVQASADLRGSVLDANAAPLAGVLVHWTAFGGGDSIEAREPSDALGRFVIPRPGGGGILNASGDRFVTVLTPYVDSLDEDGEHFVVVAPRVRFGGRVVDDAGNPLAGVQICVQFNSNLRSHFSTELATSAAGQWRTASSPTGEFAFDAAPAIEGSVAVATLAGYQQAELELPMSDRFDLVLTLRDDGARDSVLRGTVVGSDGAPIEGALVSLGDLVALGSVATETDAEGRFALTLSHTSDAKFVCALHAGLLPARVGRVGERADERNSWPDPLVIRLDRPSLSISGVVLDADGARIAGAEVWSDDRTPFAAIAEHGSEGSSTYAATAEHLLRGEKYSFPLRTDAEGRFELRGLLEKSYTLCASRESTLDFATTAPIAAGTSGVEIRMPRVERIARIAGRVTSKSGDPLGRARVDLRLVASVPGVGGREAHDLDLMGMATDTDSDGRFELRNVPRSARRVTVSSSAAAMGNTFDIADGMDLEHLEFAVALACKVRIDLSENAERVWWAKLLDPEGRELACLVMHGNTSISCNSVSLDQGRSEVFTVSEDARTFVLFEAGEELTRREIRLVPGDINVLH